MDALGGGTKTASAAIAAPSAGQRAGHRPGGDPPPAPAWSALVTRLQCLRGVSTLTAFGLAVEVGDWSRFTGSSIGAFLGLVPTEHSSGGSRSQGSITKTGNTHARRLLVEAASVTCRWTQLPASCGVVGAPDKLWAGIPRSR